VPPAERAFSSGEWPVVYQVLIPVAETFFTPFIQTSTMPSVRPHFTRATIDPSPCCEITEPPPGLGWRRDASVVSSAAKPTVWFAALMMELIPILNGACELLSPCHSKM
jgi:hypothetical protein